MYPLELNPNMTEHAKHASCIREGWYPLVVKLHNKMLAIYPDFEIDLVKEKFGKLRIYFSSQTDNKDITRILNTLVYAAEEESATICDVCGEEGKLQAIKKYLLASRCEKHLTEGTENWD